MIERTLVDYHERTKHSYESIRREGGGLDWSNEPSPFKEYLDLDAIALPPPEGTGVPAHDAITASTDVKSDAPLTTDALSYVLFHGAGVTRIFRGSFGELRFRAYASAGALYPNEVYLVSGGTEGLDAGVYHYGPRDHDLRLLREGDHRGALGLAGAQPGQASLVVTGLPWRTAWKYGTRGFRHLYWDAGMIVANVLGSGAARGVRATVLLGFVDEAVARMIGVDGETEFPLCIVALGDADAPPHNEVTEMISHRVAPVSRRPRRDPGIERAHAATMLRTEAEVEAVRAAVREAHGDGERRVERVEPFPRERLSRDGFERVVRRRGSSRSLAREAFPAGELAAVLDLALATFPSDWPSGAVRVFLVASALEGVPPGAYRYDGGGSFAEIRAGDLRRKAGFVCLEQRLAADGAAALFLMGDVESELATLGSRGYVAAQLEAAIVAGRIYLGAYAQCLGASGITFYDDEVRQLFETSAEPMLAVVVGPEGQRESIIRCRQRLTAG
ncbi:MAG TPA: SagB family peptide dehydrogenase [Actinomycetota bacterium]|nr:SagB family peptide dehydrogenase [Actinomycetota bacterium]